MKKKNSAGLVVAGVLAGMLIGTPTVHAAVEYLKALPSTAPIYVDGQKVDMEAYSINDTTYVKLRDVGAAVGFNVYWQDGVQIDSDSPYTGAAPVPASDLDAVRQEMVRLINQVRRENGVPYLAVNDALMGAAQECSDRQYTWHHTKEECESVLAHGYPHGFGNNLTVFTGAAIEEIAQCAVDNWVNSPGHFRTMIDPNGDTIGVGVTRTQNATYCYMFVGKPNSINPYG